MAFVFGALAAFAIIYLSLRFPRVRASALILLGLLALLAAGMATIIYLDR
jgi:hypothetical protein